MLCANCAAGTSPEPRRASVELLAFPGAEGAGWLAVGGRGGQALRVTTLADSGPGSLREAVEAQGPRTIIFDVGGAIQLKKPLKINNGQLTLRSRRSGDGGSC
ncbi:MAG: hypothetical protein KY449_05995 [Proteobacteria bacterium]|nr:hypothetical protein [Pseudomonadota bacterium]